MIACGKCDPCRRGAYHLCRNISFQYRKGQGALALLDRGCLDLKPLITHRIALEGLQSGFETLLNPAAHAVKAVVVMEEKHDG